MDQNLGDTNGDVPQIIGPIFSVSSIKVSITLE